MKSVILLSLFTFITCIQAFQEVGDDQISRCRAQTFNISLDSERCMNAQGGSPFDILGNLGPIILRYTDTDSDFSELDQFLEINCQRIPKIVECLNRKFQNKSECPSPDAQKAAKEHNEKLVLLGFETTTRYVCVNNGEVIKKLIPNEGAKFILSNAEISGCLQSAISSFYKPDEFCSVINSTTECIKVIAGDHPNTYMTVVGQHLLEEWRTTGNC